MSDRGRDREASLVGSSSEPGDDESESSSEGGTMTMSEADDTEIENTPLVLAKATSTTTLSARSSIHSGVPFDRRAFLTLRLPLTAFRMDPISSSLHWAP